MDNSSIIRCVNAFNMGYIAYLFFAFSFLTASLLKMDYTKFDPMLIFAYVYWSVNATIFGILFVNIFTNTTGRKAFFAYVICILLQMVLGSIYPYLCTDFSSSLSICIIITMACIYLNVVFMMIAYVRYIYFHESPLYFDIWFYRLGSNFNQGYTVLY